MAPRRQCALGLSGALTMMDLPKEGVRERWARRLAEIRADAARAYAVRRALHCDLGEHAPAKDRLAQCRDWQARLMSMAAKGRGTEAQRLAGRLLAEHGLGALRVLLVRMDADERAAKRAGELLADCGLTPWGPTTHQAEQLEAFA